MIAIDWGTSSLRAYRLDRDGRILERRASPNGILTVENQDFARALESQVGDWLGTGDAPVMMSGMIGSRQGWREVPYAACPADAGDIAAGLRDVRWNGHVAWIVPGLSCRNASGRPDVMRGEETQILGALDSLGPGKHLVCLPGTHSKWVDVEQKRIRGFSTHMTGEVFALLKKHSILGRMMREDASTGAAFADGLRESASPGGLLAHLFGVRARGLFNELDDATASSFLSGLLIGHEIHAAARPGFTVHLLGDSGLTRMYAHACTEFGIAASTLDPDAAAAALFRLSRMLSP